MNREIDILMITYNRPHYTRLALSRLLESCDDSMRVWLWHNGNDEETLAIVHELRDHPAVHQFFHSAENKRLRDPTNWLLAESSGAYLSKVDDDCLVPQGWAPTIRRAHEADSQLGIIGCWHFQQEDLVPELAERKIETRPGDHQVLKNLWVGGSGYLMKRACVDRCGMIRPRESFTDYCIRVARSGWINGWYYPLICQEHMDDPRAPHSAIRSDEDLARHMPLSAIQFHSNSVESWTRQLVRSARSVQTSSLDPSRYAPWRLRLRRWRTRLARRLRLGSMVN